MKHIGIATTILCLAVNFVFAQDAAEDKLFIAAQLVEMSDSQQIQASMDAMKKGIMANVQAMSGDMDAVGAISEVFDLIFESAEYKQFMQDMAAVYAEVFTVDELQGMLEFYRSPIGQTWLEKTPLVMEKSMEAQQKMTLSLMPRIQKAIMEAGRRSTAAPIEP